MKNAGRPLTAGGRTLGYPRTGSSSKVRKKRKVWFSDGRTKGSEPTGGKAHPVEDPNWMPPKING